MGLFRIPINSNQKHGQSTTNTTTMARELSSYELARLARIAENNEVLQQLGVSSAANAIRSDAAQANKRQKRPRATTKKKKKPEDLVPTRFSERNEGRARVRYSDDQTTTNFDFFHGDVENVVKAETMYGGGRAGGKREKRERMELAPSEFSLPENWKIYITKRKGGATRGRQDRYYQPPESTEWLRSLAEVYRWMKDHALDTSSSSPTAETSTSSSSSSSSKSSSSPETNNSKKKKQKTTKTK